MRDIQVQELESKKEGGDASKRLALVAFFVVCMFDRNLKSRSDVFEGRAFEQAPPALPPFVCFIFSIVPKGLLYGLEKNVSALIRQGVEQ